MDGHIASVPATNFMLVVGIECLHLSNLYVCRSQDNCEYVGDPSYHVNHSGPQHHAMKMLWSSYELYVGSWHRGPKLIKFLDLSRCKCYMDSRDPSYWVIVTITQAHSTKARNHLCSYIAQKQNLQTNLQGPSQKQENASHFRLRKKGKIQLMFNTEKLLWNQSFAIF